MVFKKIIFQNSLMANETPSRPPPLMANAIKNFHFDYRHPSLIIFTIILGIVNAIINAPIVIIDIIVVSIVFLILMVVTPGCTPIVLINTYLYLFREASHDVI